MNSGGKRVDEAMVMATLSDKLGWDYWTILDQPSWYVELLMRKWRVDAQIQKKQENLEKRSRRK